MTERERIEMLRNAMEDALNCLSLHLAAARSYLHDALDELAVVEEEEQDIYYAACAVLCGRRG